MNLSKLINVDSILEMGLSKIKNPQLRAGVLNTAHKARKYMAAQNPLQAALTDKGLTMDIIKREGLPLLRQGKIAEHIKKIPGSNYLISQVENYVNDNAAADMASPNPAGAPANNIAPTKAGNPFPPLKPR